MEGYVLVTKLLFDIYITAPRPLLGAHLRGHRGGQLPSGGRHRGCPHRPPSHRPEADGCGSGWPTGGDPLEGAGALFGLYPHPVQPGDWPHPPNPRPHGLYRAPSAGRSGVRREAEGDLRSDWTVPPRQKTGLPAPQNRGADGSGVSAAGLLPGSAAKAVHAEISNQKERQSWRSFSVY